MHRLMRLVALRGGNTVTEDTAEAILAATDALMREILARSELPAEDLVSSIFALTPDLDADFPPVAAREMELWRVPLLCAPELPVPGALPQVIPVVIHAYLAKAAGQVCPGDAGKLRVGF